MIRKQKVGQTNRLRGVERLYSLHSPLKCLVVSSKRGLMPLTVTPIDEYKFARIAVACPNCYANWATRPIQGRTPKRAMLLFVLFPSYLLHRKGGYGAPLTKLIGVGPKKEGKSGVGKGATDQFPSTNS